MQSAKKGQIKKIAAFIILNILILSYIEYGISHEDRYQKGVTAYQSENYSKTYNIMSFLAEKEYADAEYFLATLYLNGQGVEADQKQAVYWYKQAAKHGNKHAQVFLQENNIALEE